MVQNARPLGGQRYRESFGRSFEDFAVGDVYEHRPGRTVTQNDNTWFTLLTMNTHPLHFDEEYGRAREFGRSRRGQPADGGDPGRHERDRRQPEGDRQPRLAGDPPDRTRCSRATRCTPSREVLEQARLQEPRPRRAWSP